jgi:hypothetical protein
MARADIEPDPEGTPRLLVFVLELVLQRLRVTVAGVYRQLYRHCSEPLEPMAPVDRVAWPRACETVHIYGDTRDGARTLALVVCTHRQNGYRGCIGWSYKAIHSRINHKLQHQVFLH